MKHSIKAIFLVLMFFSFSCFATKQVGGVEPGNLVHLGDIIEGTLTAQNPFDTYGVENLEPGLYNFSLQIHGDACQAELKSFEDGMPQTNIASAVSNYSSLFQIFPESEVVGKGFIIEISLIDDSGMSEYRLHLVKIELNGNMELNQSNEMDMSGQSSSWWTLTVPEESNALEIEIPGLSLDNIVSGIIMDQSGLIQRNFYLDNFNSKVWLSINPGEYYLELSESLDEVPFQIQMNSIAVPVLRAGDSVSFELDGSEENSTFYCRLIVDEGVFYKINLDMNETLDAGFIIQHPDATGSFIYVDDFQEGESEYVSDIVWFGQIAYYSDWAFRDGEYRQIVPRSIGNPENTHYLSDYGFDLSLLAIKVFRDQGVGKARLSISANGMVDALREGETDKIQIDDSGPLWHLCKVEGLETMSEYSMLIENNPTSDIPNIGYFLARPMISDAYYLNYQRPFQSISQKAVYDNMLKITFDHGWYHDYYFTANKVLFYNSIDCDGWLLVSYENSIFGSLPLEDMSTVVTVSLSKCPNYELSLNKTQEINVTNKEYVVLKTEFESGHRYCLEVEHLDYTSYIGDITIYNETGYSDFNIDHSRGWRPQESSDSTEFYELSIKNGGTYAINILVIGDGKISVVVKDITQEEQIIQPDILLIVGIGCIGLISGLILGRASLFGSKSELHMS